MTKKLNACITVISSRSKCLKKCLKSLHDNYNCKFNYPVYVLYFDNIYDSKEYQNQIHEEISKNIYFRNIPYHSPIPESEMFYNRGDLWYVKNSNFTVKRKGYLHMCNYRINFYGYPNTPFEEYDYIMNCDDEAGYNKNMREDPFSIVEQKNIDMASYRTGQRLRNGEPHQGHRDTRIGLWNFTKNFILSEGVNPKYEPLNELVFDEDGEEKFHYLPWSDTYVFNLNFAKTKLWKKWINAVNNSGGVYKYRWGDNEIISLFGMMYQKKGIVNLGYVEDGTYDQGKFRKIQNLAPGIKKVEE